MFRFEKRMVIVPIALVTFLIGSAAASTACGTQADAQGGSVTITDADNGKTITVKLGGDLKVVLDGNPTTGYTWTPTLSEKDAAILQQQGEPAYVQKSTDPSIVGSGGTFTFTFKAATAGQATLKLDYARPFEKGVAPIQTLTVTVVVK